MRTTVQDFEKFTNEVNYWVKTLGINGWKYYFKHQKLTDARASCSIDLTARVATFFLNKNFSDKFTDVDICSSAKHEALHLLVGRLDCVARHRYINESETNEAVEELIRSLEKIIDPGGKGT